MEPTRFGHYELRELIGRGGMGEVYVAYDTNTQRTIALKVLPPHLAKDPVFQERFKRESQAAAGLNEPHIVPIHGYGEIDNQLYLDMRLIEGRTLAEILADTEKRPSPEFSVGIIEQIAAALDAAHETGLIHRDIKPSNILVTDHDFAYLIDFGLARTAGEHGLTTAGSTLGTLAYMAPERFEGGQADPRSDIYALTCVLYECLTGRRPYPADSLEHQIAGHVSAPPPKPSDVDRRLAAFDDVIAMGMAKKPGKRYQHAGELAAGARAALSVPVRTASRPGPGPRSGSGRHAVQTPEPRRRSRRIAVIALVAVIVLAAGAATTWLYWSRQYQVGPSGSVPSIAAKVPADIRDSGKLIIGVNIPYAPNEFKGPDGKFTGFDVDLITAVSRVLGLEPEFREIGISKIVSSVQDGTISVGASSTTDTKVREKAADFVTYFKAGVLWARRTGSSVDPNAACGLRVGVHRGSVEETDHLPARSAACVAAGVAPIEIVPIAGQNGVTAALLAGTVDAMAADSPVTGNAIKLSGGKLEAAGGIVDAQPYGWPVTKGSSLAGALQAALNHLIDTGEYRQIATKWGVEMGLIDKPGINGALR
ncbi:transporter substrate-binding domain-containing protein [Mycobacterium sp. CBMA293]|uniref:bifunctional serine/threonine-protein kinase/transporter substrate-binding domain-containing protein n=1 Tax=unclassified Mycolicibacterium TaxID=2636767 RepID=UPI001322150A|nr:MULTISPECIES: bifunctional serine/threonine-protein kinase/transporter substrate-binding domain-containing protein [unclassified Mycolicibacterium]MUL44781.1 transporter substrate-binding domain-containing protein [Mycolicibacterium sp. CBMA 360]MUL95374.1 transporter substrate-binding domain-containing protein [Mycolicibacterium sp. CBMA 230]MUL58110.1 transporter substrate-binding domain-containing protein [Mycolicibacterium sp. CBMA 335]MUL73568.1 transporter substrate-binding domain-cont